MPSLQHSIAADSIESLKHPSKIKKMDDGRSTSLSAGGLDVFGAGLFQKQKVGITVTNKSRSQIQSEVESATQQQVLSLTPKI